MRNNSIVPHDSIMEELLSTEKVYIDMLFDKFTANIGKFIEGRVNDYISKNARSVILDTLKEEWFSMIKQQDDWERCLCMRSESLFQSFESEKNQLALEVEALKVMKRHYRILIKEISSLKKDLRGNINKGALKTIKAVLKKEKGVSRS